MANACNGGAAQDSAHHRAAIDLIHLGRSLEIELVREPIASKTGALGRVPTSYGRLPLRCSTAT